MSISRGVSLAFVINSLNTGGAERVLERLLRFRPAHHESTIVHVILLDDEPVMRTLPPFVRLHVLNGQGNLWKSWRQLRALLREIDPDLTVSLLVRANMAAALAMRGLKGRVILCERMHIGSHFRGRYHGAKRLVLRCLVASLYRLSDCVLAVSTGVRDNLITEFRLPPSRIKTIYNPYDLETICADGAASPDIALPTDFIVAVGRLVRAKNFALLLDAYAAVRPGIALIILGEGKEREALSRQAQALGIADCVHMPGFLANPYAVVARARFLVSASRNEGFPNAIAEAMVLGRPVVATDCPSGPAELLGSPALDVGSPTQTPYGVIVPDDDGAALEQGIRLMMDPQVQAHYSRAGMDRMQAFRAEVITREYWAVFDAQIG